MWWECLTSKNLSGETGEMLEGDKQWKQITLQSPRADPSMWYESTTVNRCFENQRLRPSVKIKHNRAKTPRCRDQGQVPHISSSNSGSQLILCQRYLHSLKTMSGFSVQHVRFGLWSPLTPPTGFIPIKLNLEPPSASHYAMLSLGFSLVCGVGVFGTHSVVLRDYSWLCE